MSIQGQRSAAHCPGPLPRREFLRAGMAGFSSLSLPGLLRLKAQAGITAKRANTAVIVVWLHGGASHLETYDPKPKAAAEFRGHEGRRALVVLTDGHDVGSDSKLQDAIEAAQRADVAIYPVAVNLNSSFFHERWVLAQLAKGTGGRVSQLQPRDDPQRIFDAITADLRKQYRITYQPHIAGGTGEWRAIEVRLSLRGSGRTKRLRARPGYFAQ